MVVLVPPGSGGHRHAWTGLTTSGLPVALEFDGPSGADRKMLELGLALEAALEKLPPPPGALTPTAT
jgi:hypothetical protein